MKRFMVFTLLICIAFPLALMAANGEKLKYDDYMIQKQGYEQREADANEELGSVNGEIERLQAELDALNADIGSSWEEIYTALDTDARGLQSYLSELRSLEQAFGRWAGLEPDAMRRSGDAIVDGLKKYDELSRDNRSVFPEASELLASIAASKNTMEQKITDVPLEYLSEKNYPSSYTVIRGDCLWNIAKKPHIYNDPFKWTWIYDANKTKIQDPDLIYPGQVFAVPRDRMVRRHQYSSENMKMQYTVIPGDYLSRIAGYPQIYNNPAKWRIIYEANQDQIQDPNLILPGQVLDIPNE